jgi:hypothetical protein
LVTKTAKRNKIRVDKVRNCFKGAILSQSG